MVKGWTLRALAARRIGDWAPPPPRSGRVGGPYSKGEQIFLMFCWIDYCKTGAGEECKDRKDLKNMDATKRSNSETSQVREELLEERSEECAETTRHLREKLQTAIDKAKEVYAKLEDRTVATAKKTDHAVHEHPYQAIGIAFGIGLLVGVLTARSRRD